MGDGQLDFGGDGNLPVPSDDGGADGGADIDEDDDADQDKYDGSSPADGATGWSFGEGQGERDGEAATQEEENGGAANMGDGGDDDEDEDEYADDDEEDGDDAAEAGWDAPIPASSGKGALDLLEEESGKESLLNSLLQIQQGGRARSVPDERTV